jgi:hypothetical protein
LIKIVAYCDAVLVVLVFCHQNNSTIKLHNMKYRVATSSANLRDLPSANDNSTILAEIPFRLTFDLVDKTTADWWRVRLLNTDKEGCVF